MLLNTIVVLGILYLIFQKEGVMKFYICSEGLLSSQRECHYTKV